jgi:hypothetical protein
LLRSHCNWLTLYPINKFERNRSRSLKHIAHAAGDTHAHSPEIMQGFETTNFLFLAVHFRKTIAPDFYGYDERPGIA